MLQRFEEFMTGITECYKYIQRIKNAEMHGLGLKGIHVSCLFHLSNNPQGLTAAQLCAKCAEDKGAISRTVADLRSRGYVQSGSEKSYRQRLKLTEEGRCVAQQMEPLIQSWVEVGGQGLSPEQRDCFYACLKHISQNLQDKLA